MTASLATVLDVLLAVGLLAAAGIALFWRRRSAAVVMFLVFGLLLAIVWARLDAPDIALAEAVIGAGVTCALLLGAIAGERESGTSETTGRVLPVLGAGLAVLVAVVLARAVITVADGRGSTVGLGPLVSARLEDSGVDHPVTAVLLNFRSYDTLLEIGVVVVAVLAALSLQPRESLRAVALPPRASPVPDGLVRILVPVALLLTGWLLVAGSTRPGGAFQAGALLAGVLILLRLTGYAGVPTGRWSRPALLVGLAAFLALAFATAALGQTWLELDVRWAGTVILAIEAALTVSIGVTLATLFVANEPAMTRSELERSG